MKRSLSDQEVETLADIVIRRAGSESPLVSALRHGRVTGDQEDELADLVTAELAANGFDVNYEPTAYGIQLENFIDVLNDV